jgi:hypothetical protein
VRAGYHRKIQERIAPLGEAPASIACPRLTAVGIEPQDGNGAVTGVARRRDDWFAVGLLNQSVHVIGLSESGCGVEQDAPGAAESGVEIAGRGEGVAGLKNCEKC